MDASVMTEVPSGTSELPKHHRVTRVVLSVRFNGRTYKTSDWSMGGFILEDYDGKLATGALVTIAGIGRGARKLRSVNLPARVMHIGENSIEVSYMGLNAEAYDFLQQVMTETGKMRSLLDQSA